MQFCASRSGSGRTCAGLWQVKMTQIKMEFTITDANFFETVTEADVLDRFGKHNLIGDEQFRELAKALEEHLLQCNA